MLDDRVRAVLARLEEEDADGARAGAARASSARARSRGRPGSSSSRSSRRRPTARCSRSAARAATRRSGSPPASATSAAASLSLEHDPPRIEAWRREHRRGRPRGLGRARRRATPSRRCPRSTTSSTWSSSTPRRSSTRSSSSSPATKLEPAALVVADNVLSHVEHARRLLGRAPGRPDARERHRPARPRPRAIGDPPAGLGVRRSL